MNDAQEKTLVLIPKFIGAVSFFFSALIVWSVCRGEGKRTCYHRLLCGISIIDLSTSIWISLTSWPMPASEGFLWAVGNDMTCKTQGFFLQMSVGSSFYNVSLCVFFSLMIVFNWKEADLIEVEWLLHCIPILFALLSSFTGVFLDVYGPNPNGIWCTQRNDADAFLLYAYYLPLWMCIIIVTILCVYMWVYVSKIYKKSKERMIKMIESSCNSLWDDEKASPHEVERSGNTKVSPSRIRTTMVNNLELQTKRLKHIADQNFLYAGAFYLNWTAVSVSREGSSLSS